LINTDFNMIYYQFFLLLFSYIHNPYHLFNTFYFNSKHIF
jgi:hypothetical protein